MKDHPVPADVIPDQEEQVLAAKDDQTELLRWHFRLDHLPFAKPQLLATVGILPRGIANNVEAPGACVLVDQLESTTPGLVAQLKGILTNRRYKSAT
eukprot:2830731-Ditylum_brightwellii.AAC.1